ncbi:hypothetical protein OV208_40105 [Corallococcus sp. bb12-1]|uniref:hypothetical protein n=1 Tax=Corallococcus sp. bb12-1 TaxID=2996784 RepID=UPI002270E879|nr:hypothetical protein [Corallococcus sp. bb12-1]MCY1047572.1 hypothetical protein [Corallococcus sp. bb12-1]
MSTCPQPTEGTGAKPRPAQPGKRGRSSPAPSSPKPDEVAPAPAGMVRLLSGQLVTVEDAQQVLPRARPPGTPAPARDGASDDAPTYRREPAGDCCAHTFDPTSLHDELDALRAEVAREREGRIRAEAFAEGERAAYERVLASVLAARPMEAPSRPARPVDTSVTQPVTLASVTPQRDSVTASVTQEEGEKGREERKRELAAARQRDWRIRQRDRNAVTLEGSVTLEKKSSPPSPSAREERGTRAPAVTQPSVTALRDAAAAGLRDHRTPDTLPALVQALRAAWNELAAPHGFEPWRERTSRVLLADALAALERRPLEEWREVFARVPRSPVCRGELGSRQRACLVYVLKGQTHAGYEVAEQLLSGAWSVEPLPSAGGDAPPSQEMLPEAPAARAWRQVLDMLGSDGRHHIVGQLRLRVSPEAIEDGHLVLACADRYAPAWLAEGALELVRQTLVVLGHAGVRLREVEAPPGLPPPLAPPAPVPAAAPEPLPFELPPEADAPVEPLQDGVDRLFREVKGAAYTWRPGRDDTASRTLLSLAGQGGVPEVLRRWRHGLTATFRQRCDTLADLVQRWEANAQPEARAGTGPPGRRASAGPAPASPPEEYPQPF